MLTETNGLYHAINTLDHKSEISLFLQNGRVHEHRVLNYSGPAPSALPPADFFEYRAGAARTAQMLYDRYRDQGPLVLAVSGGIDSQAMLYAFLESGVEFRTAVMKFKDGMNEHDIGHALSLLETLGIKPEIHELDVRKFYESGEFMQYALSGGTNSPQFAAHIWLAEQIQGVPVFAGEPWHRVYENVPRPEDLPRVPFYIPRFKEYGTEISLARKGRACISHFFEISMSWFQRVNATVPMHRYHRSGDPEQSYRAKYHFYRQLGFPVSLTSGAVKLTGFERMYVRTAIENDVADYYHFNRLYRAPLEKLIPPPEVRTVQLCGLAGHFWRDMLALESSSQNNR